MNQGRKISGGKYKANRKKKKFEKHRQRHFVKIGARKLKKIRGMGGNLKLILLKENQANIMVHGKAKKAKILKVIETPSNKFLARQEVLEKGAVIETELGKARITNRPSQEAVIQAVLVEEKEK